MKKIFLTPITMFVTFSVIFTAVFGAVIPTPTAVASTQSLSYYNSAQPFNYMFNFRGVNRRITNQVEFRNFLIELIAYLQELQDSMQSTSFGEVEVATRAATNVTDDSAQLNGEITDFNDSDYATVWFEYSRTSSQLLTERSTTARIDNDENSDFELTLDDLRDDTRYYYRAVARDDRGRSDYGSTLHFTTGTDEDTTDDDEPDVITRSATDIEDDRALLRGTVDMNDFDDGEVFFVYGEDEDLIDDVEDDYDTYSDIEEDGDNLQKISIDSDLDGANSYEEEVTSLDNDRDYYFRICVDYEDMDNDNTLVCGDTRTFLTEL